MARKLLIVAAALLVLIALPAAAQAREIETSAKACIVIDAGSGRTLLSHNADERLAMASTTKVMTALMALEYGHLDERVVTGPNAFGVPGTSIYLDLGESLTLEEMLTGLMLASGNDAAVAIAEHIGGTVDVFCERMTARAAALGCTGTIFLTPHGLPCEGHFTTARDLALIAREAMRYEKFREIVSTQRATIPWQGREYSRVLNNKNKLLSTYAGAFGIKTGYTRAAGRCLVFGAERDGMTVIGVVLNCCDWFDEAARLMDVAFDEYEAITLLGAGDPVRDVPIVAGDAAEVRVVLGTDLIGVVPKRALPTLEIDLPDMVTAPIRAGDVIGEARIIVQGEVAGCAPLVAACNVYRDDPATRRQRLLTCWPLLP